METVLLYAGFCSSRCDVMIISLGSELPRDLGAEGYAERRNHRKIRAPKSSLHHHEFTESSRGELPFEGRFTILVSVALVLSRLCKAEQGKRTGVTRMAFQWCPDVPPLA